MASHLLDRGVTKTPLIPSRSATISISVAPLKSGPSRRLGIRTRRCAMAHVTQLSTIDAVTSDKPTPVRHRAVPGVASVMALVLFQFRDCATELSETVSVPSLGQRPSLQQPGATPLVAEGGDPLDPRSSASPERAFLRTRFGLNRYDRLFNRWICHVPLEEKLEPDHEQQHGESAPQRPRL